MAFASADLLFSILKLLRWLMSVFVFLFKAQRPMKSSIGQNSLENPPDVILFNRFSIPLKN
jgi:hypothetical protein